MSEQTPPDEPLSSRLGILGKIDTAVYRIEVVVAVTALVLMSVMVFADVIYQLVVTISQYLDKKDPRGWTILLSVLGFVGLMALAATGRSSLVDTSGKAPSPEAHEDTPIAVRVAVVVGAIVASVVFGWALLNMESSTVYQLLLAGFSIPIGITFWRRGDRRGLALYLVGAVLGLVVFGALPTGFSWSQSYSLIMLLWVAFLGASIAARERRHLRVDLVRKLLPPEKLPWFNAVSYLVAALFTCVVLYLGFEYILGAESTYLRPIWNPPSWLPEATRTMLMDEFPLPDDASVLRRAMQVFFAPSEPGELPDWLKVAAIPVSMLLICLRFLGHSYVFARMGMRGESFSETMGVH